MQINKNFFLKLVVCCPIFFLVYAYSFQAAAKQKSAVSLKAKPLLCVTDNENNECDIDLSVVWKATDIGRYCLFLHEEKGALQCWLEHNNGQWEKRKTIKNYAHFWMSRGKTPQKVAEVKVDVLNINPREKRRNRRRRHVWSLF